MMALTSASPNDAAREGLSAASWGVEGIVHLTALDYVRAYRCRPDVRPVQRLAVPLASILIALGLFAGFFGWPVGPLYIAALYLIAQRLLPRFVGQREFSNVPPEQRHVSYVLDDAGISVRTLDFGSVSAGAAALEVDGARHTKPSARYAWTDLLGYSESDDTFLLWVTRETCVLVPKRAFQPEALGRVSELVPRHLAARSAWSIHALRVAVFVAILLAALWAWGGPA